MADKYGVTRRQTRRYVGRGYEIIRDDIDSADVDLEKLVSQLVNSLQESMAKTAQAMPALFLAVAVNYVNCLV